MDAIARAGAAAGGASALDPERATPESAAQQFEALLVAEMLKTAQRPAFGKTLLSGGSAGAMYRDLFAEEVAQRVAAGGAFGLAGELAREVKP